MAVGHRTSLVKVNVPINMALLGLLLNSGMSGGPYLLTDG